jgi:tRNA threonylcarbamoyladenosine modification (KEOPS) complex  Pcc1 subunit
MRRIISLISMCKSIFIILLSIIMMTAIFMLTACGGSDSTSDGKPSVNGQNVNLSGLDISTGTLSQLFDQNIIAFNVQVAYSISTITVTPTAADESSAITVNGQSVTSGTASQPIDLSLGQNSIIIIVTAKDSTTSKTYTIVVTRLVDVSHNANLAGLSLSTGTLSPAFSSSTINYSAEVASETSSITVIPIAEDSSSSIMINGQSITSGNESQSIDLTVGQNTITVIVTAQDSSTLKTYTVVVTRVEDVSHNADLSNLTLSIGHCTPQFDPTILSYDAYFAFRISSITLTPTSSVSGAVISVNGTDVASGTASPSIALVEGENTVSITVTALDGFTQKTYILHIYRTKHDLRFYGPVNAMLLYGNNLIVGGNFTAVGPHSGSETVTRNRLAMIDIVSGKITEWDPNVNGTIRALAVKNNIVYVGGDFTSVGGENRSHLAAIDINTGNVAGGWNPGTDYPVYSMCIDDNLLFIGGDFYNVSGSSRFSLASLDITTGSVTEWNPGANGTVRALAVSDDIVFAGGSFTVVKGTPTNYLAAIFKTNGDLVGITSPNGSVYSLGIRGSSLFVGGAFTKMGTLVNLHIAKIYIPNTSISSWNTNVMGDVNAIAFLGDVVYVGGTFTKVEELTRNRIAALGPSNNHVTDWNPNANGWVNSALATGDTVYIGGDFGYVNGQKQSGFSAINKDTGIPW